MNANPHTAMTSGTRTRRVCFGAAGVLGPPGFEPEIPRDAVFAAAGTTAAAVKAAGDRGKAVALAADGVAKLAADLHKLGKVSGVLSLGGSAGTTIGTAAMRAL